MTGRTVLITLAVASAAGACLLPSAAFEAALHTLFPAVKARLAQPTPDEAQAALNSFRFALAVAAAAFPVSIIITEAESHPARYLQATLKSLAIALLLGGLAIFYGNEQLTSDVRLTKRIPAFFPNGPAPISITATPLHTTLRFLGIGLILFGPIDLFIARVQKRMRARAALPLPPPPTQSSEP